MPYLQWRDPSVWCVQVYVSKKHKFIYIRQPKSSSTSVMLGLVREFCHRHKRENEKTNHPIHKHCDSEEFFKVPNPRAAIDSEQWKDFFVFTVVRNPWTRMLSAYNMFNNNWSHR